MFGDCVFDCDVGARDDDDVSTRSMKRIDRRRANHMDEEL